MNASIYCTAKTEPQAESIIDALKRASFSNNDISALLPDKRGTKDFAHEHNTKAPEGATTGGVAGLGVGAAGLSRQPTLRSQPRSGCSATTARSRSTSTRAAPILCGRGG